VSNVPSQTLAALCGSRISAAHFPHGRCRTPLYFRLLSPVSSWEAASAVDGGVSVMAVEGVAVTVLAAVVTDLVSSSLTVVVVVVVAPVGDSG